MSGECDDYSDSDIDELVMAMIAAFTGWTGGSTLKVSARIEWQGSYNRQANRTTVIPGLDLNATLHATQAAQAALAARGGGKPMPKSWGAQFRSLNKTKAGRGYLAANGFKAAPQTLRRWANGTQSPGKANRDRIEAAAREQYEARASAREARWVEAARDAADAITQAIADAKGGDDVRFRDITDLEFP